MEKIFLPYDKQFTEAYLNIVLLIFNWNQFGQFKLGGDLICKNFWRARPSLCITNEGSVLSSGLLQRFKTKTEKHKEENQTIQTQKICTFNANLLYPPRETLLTEVCWERHFPTHRVLLKTKEKRETTLSYCSSLPCLSTDMKQITNAWANNNKFNHYIKFN